MTALHVRPRGWLGNRMLPLLSAMRLASVHKLDLVVHWQHIDDGFIVSFEDLFSEVLLDCPEAAGIQSFQVRADMPWPPPGIEYRRVSTGTAAGYRNRILDFATGQGDIAVEGCILLLPPSEDTERIDPTEWFAYDIGTLFHALKVRDDIMERVEALPGLSKQDTLGVHIRRAYDGSVDAYVREDRGERWAPLPGKLDITDEVWGELIRWVLEDEDRNLTNIFVASNGAASERHVRANSPCPVTWYEKRSLDVVVDVAAVQDSLVDMIALSRCKDILRLDKTTFSYISALIGHCGMDIVYPQGEPTAFIALWHNEPGTKDGVPAHLIGSAHAERVMRLTNINRTRIVV